MLLSPHPLNPASGRKSPTAATFALVFHLCDQSIWVVGSRLPVVEHVRASKSEEVWETVSFTLVHINIPQQLALHLFCCPIRSFVEGHSVRSICLLVMIINQGLAVLP